MPRRTRVEFLLKSITGRISKIEGSWSVLDPLEEKIQEGLAGRRLAGRPVKVDVTPER